VLVTALVLLVLGVVLGLFFPVMFVAAATGLVLLIVFFAGGARRAQTGAVGSDEPASNRTD
jgi:hypothetical protein